MIIRMSLNIPGNVTLCSSVLYRATLQPMADTNRCFAERSRRL